MHISHITHLIVSISLIIHEIIIAILGKCSERLKIFIVKNRPFSSFNLWQFNLHISSDISNWRWDPFLLLMVRILSFRFGSLPAVFAMFVTSSSAAIFSKFYIMAFDHEISPALLFKHKINLDLPL